jgi:hypothetical protein
VFSFARAWRRFMHDPFATLRARAAPNLSFSVASRISFARRADGPFREKKGSRRRGRAVMAPGFTAVPPTMPADAQPTDASPRRWRIQPSAICERHEL